MATLREVAQAARVSEMTVSKLLSGRSNPRRPDAVVRANRVYKAAAQLGYKLNMAARATRTGRFGAITLLVPLRRQAGIVFDPALRGLSESVESHGLRLGVATYDEEQLVDPAVVPQILTQHHSDGLILNFYAPAPPRMVELIRNYAVPAIWLNTKHDCDCVRPDDRSAGRDATRRLLEAGHRRIAFANLQGTSHYSMTERAAGYSRAMTEAGLQPLVYEPPLSPQYMRFFIPFLREQLARPDRPTAVVAYSEGQVQFVAQAAALCGIGMPDGLQVTGFSDNKMVGNGFMYDTYLVPTRQTARRAGELLLKKIAEPTLRFEPQLVPFAFEPGGS